MLPFLVMIADANDLIAAAKRLVTAEIQCPPAETSAVTVCGRRATNRFRVPFVGYDAGDRRAETAVAERHRLLNDRNACQEMKGIQVGCGFVGVHLSMGREGTTIRLRDIEK